MFQRPTHMYDTDFRKVDISEFLKDDANPLCTILDIVPRDAKVLDIGAGNGMLGWLFQQTRPSVVIDGIEPNPVGAGIARPFYRQLSCSTFQEQKERIMAEGYDFVILADVIEHIVDPFLFLEELVAILPAESKIILSIPNVAHYSTRLDLLNGRFMYTDSGLLEKTHLRFFTLTTIEQLMRALNLHIESLYFLKRTSSCVYKNKDVRLGYFLFRRLLKDRTAVTYQYLLVVGRRGGTRQEFEKGNTSIPEIMKTVFPNRGERYLRLFKPRAR